ncbi:hypothetical protein R2A130_1940 [Ahrensia sp. R2A130]|nr:hypothetical protein R2A130_1940 [Ahrensia sp. R2A130]
MSYDSSLARRRPCVIVVFDAITPCDCPLHGPSAVHVRCG